MVVVRAGIRLDWEQKGKNPAVGGECPWVLKVDRCLCTKRCLRLPPFPADVKRLYIVYRSGILMDSKREKL